MIYDVAIFVLKNCLYFVVLPLVAWFVYIRTSKFHVMANKLPGPRLYFPLIGYLYKFKLGKPETLQMAQVEWPNKLYDGIYRMFLGTGCYVVISCPEFVETMCKSQKYIEKGISYDLLLPWLGRGLLTNFGESWKQRRRMLTPAFHFDILNNFMDIFNEQSRVLCQLLSTNLQGDGNEEHAVDIAPIASRCTFDMICEAAMGVKVNAQTSESEFFHALERVGDIIYERLQKPWLNIPFLFDILPQGKELKSVIQYLNNFSDRVIEERRRKHREFKAVENDEDHQVERSKKKRLALLDLLLEASETEKDSPLTSEEIRYEINTFLFAGHDTTAALVGWFLHLMASNPTHQNKVREELFEVFGDSDRYCTQEDLSNLKYLDCCIKETLRLYPSAPLIERIASEDIRLGDHVVPKGCSVLISIYALHKNGRNFENPETFDPERFFPDACRDRHPFSYIPFSAGPRNCIGQRFALLKAKVIVSTLLRNFEFKPSRTCCPPVAYDRLVLKSLTGINLVLTRLKRELES